MIATATGRHGKLQRHRLIERPRLIKLLEGSKARGLVLVAPAGYGKTTLADQWIASGGRSGAWFRARRSSTDVAGLALDVATACTSVVPGCDERLREHLRAVPAPGDHPETLAEILGEDIAPWPKDAWLVIDEYEHVAGAEGSETFVATLMDVSAARLLVASRQPPAWATQRRILGGELFELTQSELAMAESEAAEVLGERRTLSATGVLEVAEGWPALIGLASVSTVEVGTPTRPPGVEQLPETWYRYFAEEIFGALDPAVQGGLATLALAPVIDRELAAVLVGDDRARQTFHAAVDVGIAVERGAQLDLHPLARSFLAERAARLETPASAIAEQCVAHYVSRRDWDSALELVSRYELRDHLASSLAEGLDELLESARLSSVDEWCAAADRLSVESAWVALARAEAALRQARFTEAQASAEVAAADPTLTYRALSVAGRSAHMGSREKEAVALYRRAAAAASSEDQRRETLLCEVNCLIDLESPQVARRLTALRSSVVRANPYELLRSTGIQVSYELKFGPLDLSDADRAYELLNVVRDPMATTSFLCIYGGALVATARYPEALAVAESLTEASETFRVDFARPYASCISAMAHAGLRQWAQASERIEDALTRAPGRDIHATQLATACAIRLLLQQGKYEEALALDVPQHPDALRAGTAEVLASRALAFASASRLREARDALASVHGLSIAIEPMVLVQAVRATVAIKSGDPEATELARVLAATAAQTGAVDLLVTAYRATPALLRLLLKIGSQTDEFTRLVMRVGDRDLAQAVGHSVDLDDRRSFLSKREREVLGLIEEGFTNRQIATALYISESTAKVHAHRIYEKLGIHSRKDLAVQAQLRGRDQATSAMGTADGSGARSSLL